MLTISKLEKPSYLQTSKHALPKRKELSNRFREGCKLREVAATIADKMLSSPDAAAAASETKTSRGDVEDVEAQSARGHSCGGACSNLWKTRSRAAVLACRGWTKHVISRTWFDSAVCGVILVNCVFLALDDPTAEVRALQVLPNELLQLGP